MLCFYEVVFGGTSHCITGERNPIYRKEEKGETLIRREAVMKNENRNVVF
jgi:hypothetical protein